MNLPRDVIQHIGMFLDARDKCNVALTAKDMYHVFGGITDHMINVTQENLQDKLYGDMRGHFRYLKRVMPALSVLTLSIKRVKDLTGARVRSLRDIMKRNDGIEYNIVLAQCSVEAMLGLLRTFGGLSDNVSLDVLLDASNLQVLKSRYIRHATSVTIDHRLGTTPLDLRNVKAELLQVHWSHFKFDHTKCIGLDKITQIYIPHIGCEVPWSMMPRLHSVLEECMGNDTNKTLQDRVRVMHLVPDKCKFYLGMQINRLHEIMREIRHILRMPLLQTDLFCFWCTSKKSYIRIRVAQFLEPATSSWHIFYDEGFVPAPQLRSFKELKEYIKGDVIYDELFWLHYVAASS